MKGSPVLVFDSGVGGLPYLEAIRSLLPYERLEYLADSGHFPYGLKTREDGDMDTWLAKVRKHLLPHVDRLTFIITNNWNFHAVNELQKMGFLVARTERAGESPELVAMSGRARHIIAPAIRTVDYLGQKVKQEGGNKPTSASNSPA